MKFIRENNTVLSGKVLLRAESWENDGDNYRWEEALFDNMGEAEVVVNILKKHKNFGNGKWNPNCSDKERDIISDWVGLECYTGFVRVLETIEVVTFDVVAGEIIKTIRVVNLYE